MMPRVDHIHPIETTKDSTAYFLCARAMLLLWPVRAGIRPPVEDVPPKSRRIRTVSFPALFVAVIVLRHAFLVVETTR